MLKRKECETATTSATTPLGGHGELGFGGVKHRHHHHHRPNHHHVPPTSPKCQRQRLLLFVAGMMIVTLSGVYSVRMLLLGGGDSLYYYTQLESTLIEAAAAAATANQESHHQLRRSPLQTDNKNDNGQTDDHHHNKPKTKLPNKVVDVVDPTNSTSTSSSSSSNVVFFPPIVAPKNVKNNECRIGTSSSFRYLDCGYNGQVFAVECENHAQPKQKQQQQQEEEPFVVKLLTIPANRSDKIKFGNGRIGMYKSDTTDNTRRYRELYQRLLSSNTNSSTDDDDKEKVLRHFALQRGVVNLSPDVLLKATASANRTLRINSPFRGMVLYPLPGTEDKDEKKQPSPLVIQGKIYGYYKGQSIQGWLPAKEKFGNTSRLFYEERQYQVIRDLVYIYRHLYRQHILVSDLKLNHFLYSQHTNDTTLIDLDEFRYGRLLGRPHFNTYTEQWQQWQLLTVIANVCDYEVQHERERENPLLSPSGLALIVCGGKGGNSSLLYEAKETWASSFAKCGFDRLMVWSRDMFNHTEATYEALATWSGLSS